MNHFLFDVCSIGVAECYFARVVAVDDVGAHDTLLRPNDVVVVVGQPDLLFQGNFARVFDDVRIDDIDVRFNLGEHCRFAFVTRGQATSLFDGISHAALQVCKFVEARKTPRTVHADAHCTALWRWSC